MSAVPTTLYTPQILALAVELADSPLASGAPLTAEIGAQPCGSRIAIGLYQDEDGAVSDVGARVRACAIGQAAAALFLRSVRGRGYNDIAEALAALKAWLADRGSAPDWPDIEILEAARAYPARHDAILLPWKAALAALPNPAVTN
ncbi:iron-sulfur cluster assembly scaffold protein [Qipengyuania sp.]|uniref:iron-sulfur cluster assembly scaffold protein n=1 Tax=Qipengyuania sp. TaxID=2004515 RepID=UPI0035C7AD6F